MKMFSIINCEDLDSSFLNEDEQMFLIKFAAAKWKNQHYNNINNVFYIEAETEPPTGLEIQGSFIDDYHAEFHKPPPTSISNKSSKFELLHIIVARLRSVRQLRDYIDPPDVPELEKMSIFSM